jgi:hypothetical protein
MYADAPSWPGSANLSPYSDSTFRSRLGDGRVQAFLSDWNRLLYPSATLLAIHATIIYRVPAHRCVSWATECDGVIPRQLLILGSL